jgi:hypothetical protein
MKFQKLGALALLSIASLVACTVDPQPYPYNAPLHSSSGSVSLGSSSSGAAEACEAPNRAFANAGNGVQLPVPEYFQQCSEWCWAASITMVAEYFGRPVQECELASAKTGFACCNYAACGFDACNQAAQPGEIDVVLSRLGVHGTFRQGALDEQSLANELDHGRPVIVGYVAPFAGHVAVISGYRVEAGGRVFHVVDPWPQFGAFDAPWVTIAQGPNMPWSFTWSGLNTGSACGQ